MNVFKRKRRGLDGKLIVAQKYSARHRFPGESKPRTIPLHVTRKDVAEKLGREWVAREERKLAGLMVDPVETETAETSLAKLIDEFRDSLKARGLEADYVRKPVQRCRDLFRALGWYRVADASALDLRRYLERSTWSASTRNHYLDAATQFYRWLHRDGRVPKNPIGDVPRFKVAFTETYDRAAFTEDELRRLIDPNTEDTRRLYRADVYALMVFSGLRWKEAGRLQVRDIRKDDDGYSILIPRGKDKSNRGDVIELPDELLPVIERLVADRGPSERLLHGGCPTRHTFKRDCERAGIERVRGDGSRIVRYSSRDTYTSLLRVVARTTDQVRALTRHTTRGMEDRYTDRKTQGLRSLVNAIPIVVRTQNHEDHSGSQAGVHMSVHTPAHATENTIPRGFDSPRLHSLTHDIDRFLQTHVAGSGNARVRVCRAAHPCSGKKLVRPSERRANSVGLSPENARKSRMQWD
ncbi:MAG: tyrosine-type recombinase/integrase [Phycisphaerales bacterium]